MEPGWLKWLAGATLLAGSGALVLVTRGAPSPVSSGKSALAPATRAAPSARAQSVARDLKSKELGQTAPYIPAQCYTKTRDEQGRVHNPCYTCHAGAEPPNYIDDAELQLSFAFPEPALVNPWRNLFVDRRPALSQITDEEVLAYVRASNYIDGKGQLLLQALRGTPSEWDTDGDGVFGGYVADAYFAFDEQGFDRGPDGQETGWRAYAYYPFPGTFWPANGSAGDALIRLPLAFRQNERGELDRQVYVANLAILEALIKREDVPIASVDERALGVDLDKDGRLARATRVTYDWAPLEKHFMSFVGKARLDHVRDKFIPAAGLFPVGSELLHSVRYLDVLAGRVTPAARMKELRYVRKRSYRTYSQLEMAALEEGKEKHDYPDRLRQVLGDLEHGVSNGQGWVYQGFIESAEGSLRPQTYAESVFCVGCHGGVSTTTDGVFSFARKLPAKAERAGWYHFSQRGLEGLPEPRRKDGRPEYRFYLEQNGAGDELRQNAEIMARFFDQRGNLKPSALRELERDVSVLLLPSAARARNEQGVSQSRARTELRARP